MVTRSQKISNAEYRLLRTKAEKMRLCGLSYKEIQKDIPVSKSTLSLWCRDIKLTIKQKKRLGSLYDKQHKGAKTNQRNAEIRRAEERKKGSKLITKTTDKKLLVAGAMLYWAEGTKKQHTAIANSDPSFIVFFIKWLGLVLNIKPSKIKAQLHIHNCYDEEKEKKFWSKITKIPLENFDKTYIKPVSSDYRKNKLYHGTLRLRVSGKKSTYVKEQILGMVEEFIKYYIPNKIVEDHYNKRMRR
ncbi:hypothetical protein KJ785_00295 [Patescibacteria group bacterium]|nr:hypothetical protein [Patescibacteria group bacterium]